MSAGAFSNTDIPPIVRVSNSADAPVLLVPRTAPSQPSVTVHVIRQVGVARDTQVVTSQLAPTTLVRGRRSKSKKRK